jgi:deoxycytidine triphosphate deaminase
MTYALTASISCVIKPGANVSIPTNEEIKLLDGYAGVLGLRREYASKGLIMGATIVKTMHEGNLHIQVTNTSNEPIEIYKDDHMINLTVFEEKTIGCIFTNLF